MKKLYDFCLDDAIRKKELYIKENNECIDLVTYFNSFSPKKWNKYTNVKRIGIQIEIEGQGLIQVVGFSLHREDIVFEQLTDHRFTWESDIDRLDHDVLGIRIIKKSPNVSFISGTYMGECKEGSDFNYPKIAIAICTYKREEYLKKNLVLLRKIVDSNKNYSVTVVDNGNTLEEKDDNGIRVIHNLNYGGSGGFTRGLIENVDDHDYIILMDDDIEIGPGVLEKTYSFLSVIKDEYHEHFLSGSMLIKDKPNIQEECTANWLGIKLISNGKNYNLSQRKNLIKNENIKNKKNSYAAWWYCAIPSVAVSKIGYPLPIFIKCDDMEYSLRNKGKVISLNGIGVWHEAFDKKYNAAASYYGIRNSFILNTLIGKSSFFFLVHAFLRMFQGIYKGIDRLNELFFGLQDFQKGLTALLVETPLQVHQEVGKKKRNGNIINIIYINIVEILKTFFKYKKIRSENILFVNNNLKNNKFWKKLLKI